MRMIYCIYAVSSNYCGELNTKFISLILGAEVTRTVLTIAGSLITEVILSSLVYVHYYSRILATQLFVTVFCFNEFWNYRNRLNEFSFYRVWIPVLFSGFKLIY